MAIFTSTDKPETHYGNDNAKYKFKPIQDGKGKDEEYFVLVNKKTGKTEVWNEEFGQDRMVGEYDPKTKKFTPEPRAGWLGNLSKGSREFEEEYFTSEQGKNAIISAGKNVVSKEVYNDAGTGASKEDRLAAGNQKANELLNTGSSTIDESNASSLKGLAEEQRESLMATKGRKFFPNLRYPEKMDEKQDAIKFTLRDFKPREWDSTQPGVLKERNRENAALDKFNMGSVVLPMPGGIKDAAQYDWGNASMNPLEALAAQTAMAAFTSGDAVSGLLKNVVSDMGASDMTKTAQQLIAGQISGTGGQLIQRQGAVINPNVELLFGKPQLRSFQFNFNLSPRNAKEAQTVKQIIRLFKQASAPRRTIKGYFLKTPLVYQLEYINNAYNLNRFKECAMINFSTDYTPNGNYSTFRDGTMTQYKIAMEFTELDPIFNDDYDTLDKDGENANLNDSSIFSNGQGPLGVGNLKGGADSAGIGY